MRPDRAVGGLMMSVAGRPLPTAIRLEWLPAPACWRCSSQLFFDSCELVPGEEAFPWVWVCPGCVTDDDRHSRCELDEQGVRAPGDRRRT